MPQMNIFRGFLQTRGPSMFRGARHGPNKAWFCRIHFFSFTLPHFTLVVQDSLPDVQDGQFPALALSMRSPCRQRRGHPQSSPAAQDTGQAQQQRRATRPLFPQGWASEKLLPRPCTICHPSLPRSLSHGSKAEASRRSRDICVPVFPL